MSSPKLCPCSSYKLGAHLCTHGIIYTNEAKPTIQHDASRHAVMWLTEANPWPARAHSLLALDYLLGMSDGPMSWSSRLSGEQIARPTMHVAKHIPCLMILLHDVARLSLAHPSRPAHTRLYWPKELRGHHLSWPGKFPTYSAKCLGLRDLVSGASASLGLILNEFGHGSMVPDLTR